MAAIKFGECVHPTLKILSRFASRGVRSSAEAAADRKRWQYQRADRFENTELEQNSEPTRQNQEGWQIAHEECVLGHVDYLNNVKK